MEITFTETLVFVTVGLLCACSIVVQILIYSEKKKQAKEKNELVSLLDEKIEEKEKELQLVSIEREYISHSNARKGELPLSNALYSHIVSLDGTNEIVPLKDDDWSELFSLVNDSFNNFTERLKCYCSMNEFELQLSVLIKLKIRPNICAQLTNHSIQAITTARSRLYTRAFGKRGTGKDWDLFIESL